MNICFEPMDRFQIEKRVDDFICSRIAAKIENHSSTPDYELIPELSSIFTVDDVADYLKINNKAVYALIHSGKLPYFKPDGKQFRITKRDLISFIERGIEEQERERQQGNLDKYKTLFKGR